MKNITKILYSIACAGAMFSCSQDEFSIEKNTTLEWDIDETIKNADIRTRIGYDPRLTYVYFPTEATDVSMLSHANLQLSSAITKEIEVVLDKPAEKDVKVRLAYDAELYEELRNIHTGYELGSITLATLDAAEKTISAGEKSVKFQVTLQNNPGQANKELLPFKLSLPEGETAINIVKGLETFALRINPEVVDFYFERTNIEVVGLLVNNRVNVLSALVTTNVRSSHAIPQDLTVGLERYQATLPGGAFEAPDDIVGILPTKAFRDTTSEFLSFELQNYENITEEGDYILPIRLVLYDAESNAYPQSATVTVKLTIVKENLIAAIGENLAQGTRLSKQGFQVSGASYGSEIIDNIYGAMNDYNYGMVSSNGVMTITFPEQKKIKSIRFDMRNDLRSVDISTRNGTVGAFTTQGTARVSTPGKWFVIIFSEAVDASQIQFSKFITTTGGSASIHEMDFYTE